MSKEAFITTIVLISFMWKAANKHIYHTRKYFFADLTFSKMLVSGVFFFKLILTLQFETQFSYYNPIVSIHIERGCVYVQI